MIKIWVIYERPTDYPHAPFVMREHHVRAVAGEKNAVIPTEHVWTGELGELRRKVPAGKMRMPRAEADEPQIVEWYF